MLLAHVLLASFTLWALLMMYPSPDCMDSILVSVVRFTPRSTLETIELAKILAVPRALLMIPVELSAVQIPMHTGTYLSLKPSYSPILQHAAFSNRPRTDAR